MNLNISIRTTPVLFITLHFNFVKVDLFGANDFLFFQSNMLLQDITSANKIMSGLVPIAASATTGIWFLPILMGALSYYQYDRKDPEGRPKDTKVSTPINYQLS